MIRRAKIPGARVDIALDTSPTPAVKQFAFHPFRLRLGWLPPELLTDIAYAASFKL
jgi:hypothetical protein